MRNHDWPLFDRPRRVGSGLLRIPIIAYTASLSRTFMLPVVLVN